MTGPNGTDPEGQEGAPEGTPEGTDPTTDTPAEDWRPPSREQHARDVAQRNKLKEQLREARAALEAATVSGSAAEKAQREAATQQAAKTKRQGVIAALAGLGLERAAAKKLLPLVDMDSVEVDEDDDVDASAAIDALKAEFPQLFPAANGSRRVVRTSDPSGGRPANGTRSADQRHSDALLRQLGIR